MKITDVRTFIVTPKARNAGVIGKKNWLFVRVETDEGIHGWGEAYTQLSRDKNMEELVREIGKYLIGRDPFNIKHFVGMVYDDFASRRGSMDLYCALSGIEQSMWDIIGKKLGVPIYNLLGGACRDKIRVYANGWYTGASTPEEYASKAADTLKQGFTALKFDPFPDPWRLYISERHEDMAVDIVSAVRDEVGSDVDLLIEGHRRLAPMNAIRFSKKIEKFRLFWYEEPVPVENVPALAEVRERTNIPIVTGETLYTKAAFREVFERRSADIINPDIGSCGILELKEIAAMAEPYYVAVSPHNYNSTTIALAATIQVAACIPNFLITEYFVNFRNTGDEIAINPFEVDNGYIRLPSNPGLGLDLDMEKVLERSYEEQEIRSLRQYFEEGP